MPNVTLYKPAGVPGFQMEVVVLTPDEVEALRLKDYEGLDQNAAAEKMNISQPTFYRILSSARRKIADALINGKAIQIEKSDYVNYVNEGDYED